MLRVCILLFLCINVRGVASDSDYLDIMGHSNWVYHQKNNVREITAYVKLDEIENDGPLHVYRYDMGINVNSGYQVHIDVKCRMCETAVFFMRNSMKVSSEPGMRASFVYVCNMLQILTPEVCAGLANNYVEILIKTGPTLFANPTFACSRMLREPCGPFVSPYPEWRLKIPDALAQPPTPTPWPSSGSLKILHISDIHMDSEYKYGAEASCKQPICCRSDSVHNRHQISVKAGKFGTYTKCDMPKETLVDLFKHLSQQRFDVIYWTGDLPPHNVWAANKEDIMNDYTYLVELFAEYFRGTPIHFAVGNHESAPADGFPSEKTANANPKAEIDWLYRHIVMLWGKHLSWVDMGGLASRVTVIRGGFYTALLRKGHRIISLNNNYCDYLNWWLLKDSADPNGQLLWFIATLEEAERKNERVHLLAHIPPGLPDCLKYWSWNFYSIVDRFSHIITAQFYGHTHTDSYEVFYAENPWNDFIAPVTAEPNNIAYVVPSVTPYQDLDPSYRIYDMDSDTTFITDHHTWVLNLAELSDDHTGPLPWTNSYSAMELYDLPDLSPRSWHDMTIRMLGNNTLFDIVYSKFFKDRVLAPCDTLDCRREFVCKLLTGRSYDEQWCDRIIPLQPLADMLATMIQETDIVNSVATQLDNFAIFLERLRDQFPTLRGNSSTVP